MVPQILQNRSSSIWGAVGVSPLPLLGAQLPRLAAQRLHFAGEVSLNRGAHALRGPHDPPQAPLPAEA